MSTQDKVRQLVEELNLEPHPEGGFFKETYRSEEVVSEDILGRQYEGPRHCSTAIYFLLTSENFSAFHRIIQDEMWHFYKGSPLLLHTITAEGIYKCIEIGNDISAGQKPQELVPGGVWFATEVKNPNDYSLVGCTVSPGFDFNDFELADRQKLAEEFPQHKGVIKRLTRM